MVRIATKTEPFASIETCGDFFVHESEEESDFFAVGDVGGHGSAQLPAIAEECKRTIGEHANGDIRHIFFRVHDIGEVKRRGVALLIGRLYRRLSLLEYVAVGTMQLTLIRDDRIRRQPIQEGIVGYTLPETLKTVIVKTLPGDAILITSDGISIHEQRLRRLPWGSTPDEQLLAEITDPSHNRNDDRIAVLIYPSGSTRTAAEPHELTSDDAVVPRATAYDAPGDGVPPAPNASDAPRDRISPAPNVADAADEVAAVSPTDGADAPRDRISPAPNLADVADEVESVSQTDGASDPTERERRPPVDTGRVTDSPPARVPTTVDLDEIDRLIAKINTTSAIDDTGLDWIWLKLEPFHYNRWLQGNLTRLTHELGLRDLTAKKLVASILELLITGHLTQLYLLPERLVVVADIPVDDAFKFVTLFDDALYFRSKDTLRACLGVSFPHAIDRDDSRWAFYKELLQEAKDYEAFLEVKKKETEITRLQQQAKMASLGEMIGNIAHQWRQPINALGIFNAALVRKFRNGNLDAATVETFYEKSGTLIQNMSQTIDVFRNFFNPKKVKGAFDIRATVDKAVDFVDASFKSHEIDVSIDGSPGAHTVSCGFENELLQVLVNILNNAKDAIVQHRRSGGHVAITLGAAGGHLRVTVCDNGGGVDEEAIDKVFEPYFTTKFQSNGTGLGLYMSKMLIERSLEGRISIRNDKDGACCEVLLPRGSAE